MDPFERAARGARSFRAVPMTHLSHPTQRAAHSPSTDAGPSAPPRSTPVSFRTGSTILSRVDLHSSADADGGDVSNVRKWQQFGLRVNAAELASSPVVSSPRQSWQQQQQQQQRAPGIDVDSAVLARTAHGAHNGSAEQRSEIDGRRGNVLPLAHSPHGGGHVVAPQPAESRTLQPQRNLLSVVEVVDDDDDYHTPPPTALACNRQTAMNSPSRHDRSPSSPTPAAPPPAQSGASAGRATDRNEDDSAAAARHLHATLAQLSAKVQHSTEEQRCGPPQRSTGGGGGGPPSWASKRWGGKAPKKGKTKDGDDNGDNNEGDKSDATTRKRTRAAKGSATETAGKRGSKRKRGGEHDGGAAPAAGDGAAGPASRTLFSFTATNVGAADGRGLAGLQAAPTAAATVSVPFFYLQTSADELFNDVRRTLHDPDRIQAPPLFVGLSTLVGGGGGAAVECRTNFTCLGSGLKTVKGRAPSCFSSVDPVHCHQHVELVMARWKDAVYALPAQTLGFSFLCRVLRDLAGVEVITFNAQALLIALLAYTKGTLWSHCVSDVRVMAWMAQLHVSPSSAQAPRSVLSTGLAGGDGDGDASSHVLYDYDQLLLRVSSGKVPPSVLLERASESDIYSGGGSVHAMSGYSSSATCADHAAPPLTPAQRLLAQQVYYLATVYRSLYGLLGSKGLLQAFLRQEKRVALLLALMRFNGTGVDLREVHRYQRACETEMARQRALASSLVPEMGSDFNIQSHDQCRTALYEVLQLGKLLTAKTPSGADAPGGSGLSITKGGRLSTAEDTLRALAAHHQFPACLLKYRKASKLMQTYVEGMMGYAIVRTGKTGRADGDVDSASGSAAKAIGIRDDEGSCGSGSAQAPPALLGETLDVNEQSNPFVDRHLHAAGPPASLVRGRSSPSPANAHSRPGVDEEASVTAIGDVALPGRGYATIHPNFLQEGTETGRLSCVEPNLQNLPRNGGGSLPAAPENGTDAAQEGAVERDGEEEEEDLLGFRRCFIAPPGCVLVSVDYQQIELRVLAHLCGDKSLIDALTSSADIHRAIAEVVFKKKPVSSEERSLAKRVVFGMLYGAGPKTLAAHMGVTVERALHITSLLTNAFPGIETYHRRVVEESRVNGFVRTISGRLRYLPDIQSTVMARRSYAERQAFNSVVQGSAADVMKMSMLAVEREVLQKHSRDDVALLSQIHDEMVFSVRKELLTTMVPRISFAMSHAMHLLVPLSVTVKFGHSLGSLREWSVEHDLGLGVEE